MHDGMWWALGAVAALSAFGGRRGSRSTQDLDVARQEVIDHALRYAPDYQHQVQQPWAVASIIEDKLWENATGPRPSYQPSDLTKHVLDDAIEDLSEKAAKQLFVGVLRQYEGGGEQAVRRRYR